MRRFSLQTFFLAIMLIAALLALGTVQYRYWKLESEVVLLRKEVGHLGPIDPNRINIIQVPTPNEPLVWKWRIYVPAGMRFDAGITFNDIPPHGVPNAPFSALAMESNENGILLTAAITPDTPNGNNITLSIGTGCMIGNRTNLPLADWFAESSESEIVGTGGPETFSFDQTITLIRYRLCDPKTGVTPTGDARGFMI